MWLYVSTWPRRCSSVDGITCSSKFPWVMKQLQLLWCSVILCSRTTVSSAIYVVLGCNLYIKHNANFCSPSLTCFVWNQPHPWHSLLLLHVYSECQFSHTIAITFNFSLLSPGFNYAECITNWSAMHILYSSVSRQLSAIACKERLVLLTHSERWLLEWWMVNMFVHSLHDTYQWGMYPSASMTQFINAT